VVPYPNRKLLFAWFTCSQAQHGLNRVQLIRNQLVSINGKKKTDRMEGRPLRAIDERTVFRDPESAGCSKLRQIRLRGIEELFF
jgi:hypothetical protein